MHCQHPAACNSRLDGLFFVALSTPALAGTKSLTMSRIYTVKNVRSIMGGQVVQQLADKRWEAEAREKTCHAECYHCPLSSMSVVWLASVGMPLQSMQCQYIER